MGKRVAVVISGAVSLGSYEAGVLFEVVSALGGHNTQVPEADQILIDVVVGASAGGMTAAILVQKGLLDAAAFGSSASNPLHDTWVQRISLEKLFHTVDRGPRAESAMQSLFSSDLIERLAHEVLTADLQHGPLPGVRHPAFAPEVRLGLALTNLNGIDYGRNLEGGGRFIYTGYEDQLTRVLSASSNFPGIWTEIRDAALASGAFPYAFRPRDLKRFQWEFETPGLVPWTEPERTFAYTDGGCVQSQPLGMAKDLVDQIDHHLGDEDRIYLFVSADPMSSKADGAFRAGNADFGPFSRRFLMGVMWGQAGFQDWIKADKVNARVRDFDAQVEALTTAVLADQPRWQTLGPVTQPILARQWAESPEGLVQARRRLQRQYRASWDRVEAALGAPGAQAWADLVLVLETAADLGDQETMNIVAMTADPGSLAGADLFYFLGFFSQTYRQHDYDCGRAKAQTVLRGWKLANYHPEPVTILRPDLAGLKFSGLPAAQKAVLYRGLSRRLGQLATHLPRPWSFLLKPFLGPLAVSLFKHFVGPRPR